MANTAKTMNRFINSINNQTTLFNVYYHYADSEELKCLLKDVLDTYNRHEDNIIDATQRLNYVVWSHNSFKQNMTLKSKKKKVKKMKDDFKISIEAIKSMDEGIISGLEFVYKNKELDSKFIEAAKSVVEDYDELSKCLKAYVKKYQN